MLAAQLFRTNPGLVLLQNPDNLFFAGTTSRHHLSPQLENRLTLNAGLFRRAGHPLKKAASTDGHVTPRNPTKKGPTHDRAKSVTGIATQEVLA